MLDSEIYEATVKDLLAFFGDKRMLTITDCAKYLGRTHDWCKHKYGLRAGGITIFSFARKLSNK